MHRKQRRDEEELAEHVRERRYVGHGVHGRSGNREDQRRYRSHKHPFREGEHELVQHGDRGHVDGEVDDAPRHRIEPEELEFGVIHSHGERTPVRRQVIEKEYITHVCRERARLDVAEHQEVVAEEVVRERREVDAHRQGDDPEQRHVAPDRTHALAQRARVSAFEDGGVRSGNNCHLRALLQVVHTKVQLRDTPDVFAILTSVK